MSEYDKQFKVVCPNAFNLRGKKVFYRIEIDQKIVSRSGTFQVHRVGSPEMFLVDIDTFLRETDPPNSYFLIHLSQAHIDSIVPAKQNDIGIDFEVTRPFLCHQHIPDTPPRQNPS